MAKALIGHMGGPSTANIYEAAQLRRKVADLQAEVLRLQNENEGLLKSLSERVDDVTVELLEPAH